MNLRPYQVTASSFKLLDSQQGVCLGATGSNQNPAFKKKKKKSWGFYLSSKDGVNKLKRRSQQNGIKSGPSDLRRRTCSVLKVTEKCVGVDSVARKGFVDFEFDHIMWPQSKATVSEGRAQALLASMATEETTGTGTKTSKRTSK